MSFEAFRQTLIWIFSAFTPVWYPEGAGPETPEERARRWEMIVQVVTEEAAADTQTPFKSADDAALVVSILRGESALDYHVHGGTPSPIGNADNGLSLCMGQIQHAKAWWTEEQWRAMAGLTEEATRLCVQGVLRVLGYHAQRCQMRAALPKQGRWDRPLFQGEALRVIAAYGKGHCVVQYSKTAQSKARDFTQIQRHLKNIILEAPHAPEAVVEAPTKPVEEPEKSTDARQVSR